ncbi:MAG: Uma2 family endonuclease [Lachnospiraceae bacterium]|nr:Uma2 family endonuclease [Lachnospiraceae bacterium]
MSALPKEMHTVQDILELPEGVRMELIDGILYDMATPSLYHQNDAGSIFRQMSDYFEKKGGRCKSVIAPFAVYLNDDDRTYVEPDVLVVCDEEKLKEDGCHGAPDLCVEVVSESSRKRDYLIKLLKYTNAGVREYWIIDRDHNRITVYHLEKEDFEEYTFADEIVSGIYEGLKVKL